MYLTAINLSKKNQFFDTARSDSLLKVVFSNNNAKKLLNRWEDHKKTFEIFYNFLKFSKRSFANKSVE